MRLRMRKTFPHHKALLPGETTLHHFLRRRGSHLERSALRLASFCWQELALLHSVVDLPANQEQATGRRRKGEWSGASSRKSIDRRALKKKLRGANSGRSGKSGGLIDCGSQLLDRPGNLLLGDDRRRRNHDVIAGIAVGASLHGIHEQASCDRSLRNAS